jgi:hypothetical protein
MLLSAFTIAALLACSATAQQQKGRDNLEKLVEALAQAPTLNCNYSEDGAADATVMEQPVQAVKDIVKLRGKAIPFLIQHLNDLRLTNATFNGGFSRDKPIRVPVGYICLDILLSIVSGKSPVKIRNCFDDGLGACVEPGYYFRPDEYYPAGENYLARDGVYRAKKNWQQAYSTGKLNFSYPVWWEK